MAVVPELDGKVLGDPAWLKPSLSGFWQQRPVEGTRSTQETEVYIGYTDTTLYVGIVAYDDDPSGIIMADSRRDASLENGDNVSFIIDSFMDQQNGLVFGTNPAGIEYDAQVSRQASGSMMGSGGFNLNWDTNWRVETHIGDYGWSAEFQAVPGNGQDDEEAWRQVRCVDDEGADGRRHGRNARWHAGRRARRNFGRRHAGTWRSRRRPSGKFAGRQGRLARASRRSAGAWWQAFRQEEIVKPATSSA